jgi:hypothetical protein
MAEVLRQVDEQPEDEIDYPLGKAMKMWGLDEERAELMVEKAYEEIL